MALVWDLPRPDEGKRCCGKVKTDYSMGGEGGELKGISACGLKLSDRVWYNAIYYIAYSFNLRGVN